MRYFLTYGFVRGCRVTSISTATLAATKGYCVGQDLEDVAFLLVDLTVPRELIYNRLNDIKKIS